MFYKRRFNMNIQSLVPQARQRFSLFDLYFDCQKLRWDFLQDNLDYKMKMHHDQVRGMLLIPTLEFSQAYYSMETLFSTLWFDTTRDKTFRLLGPAASGKSTILQTYMKRNPERFNALWTPMSTFMSTRELKKKVESYYVVKRKSKLEPKDKNKRVIIVIDDLHLHDNYRDNLVDFIRTWTASHGYFDMQEGIFKEVGDFGVLLAQNSQYGKHTQEKTVKEENRYLFYACTQHMEEPEQEKTKLFIQHWLTSRMWNCSKLINKYYILITNVLMTIFDKMMRTNDFNRSSFLELTNFHFVAKFCQNLTNFTFLSDVWAELVPKNRREEDAIAEMVSYEIMRTFSDRILFPNQRQVFLGLLKDAIKQEFFSGGYLSVEYLDKLVMGNYHDKKPSAYVKYASQSEENEQKVKQKVREIVKEDSTNQFLEAYLDSPMGLREVFRICRLLYKENMHGLLVGPNGTGKLEQIQIAAVVNSAIVLELSVSKFNDAVTFLRQLKTSMLTTLKLQSYTFLAIQEVHHADIAYVDAIYNILQALESFQNSIVFDDDFVAQLCDLEEQNMLKKDEKNLGNNVQASKGNREVLFYQAMRKVQKYFHICLLLDNLQTYQDWISKYPSLEHQMEVMYFDELAIKGYQKMANSFFENKKLEASDISISKSLSQGRQVAKNRILDVFYTPNMMGKTIGEDFHDCLGEFIFSKADKLHKFIYYDSDFEPIDSQMKQKFPNVRMTIRQTYKSRFVLYLELFRFLYDFLSLSLLVRQNYLETYLKKSSEFTEFFRKIKGTKNTLHCESTELSVKLYQLRDKRDNIRMLLREKQTSIQRRQQESDLQGVELRAYQKEVDEVIKESNKKLEEVIQGLKEIKPSEFQYLLTSSRFIDSEKGLLNVIAVIIEQDPEAEFSREAHQAYFVDKLELCQLLQDKSQADLDPETLSRLRFWLADVQSSDFKRPLFKQLHAYVASAFKRLSVKTVMYATYKKIDEIKEILESCKFSISYSQQFTKDKSRELAEVEAKIGNLEQMENNLSKRIEEAEISHMRTEHIYDQIDEYHQLQTQKLESVKKRLKTLQGDCIMLASSVTYLSIFAMKERVQLRQELWRYMQAQNISASESWKENDFTLHCKMFKRILKEYGLKQILKKHSFQNGLSQEVFAETLFSIVFAPSCPVLFDPSGHVLEFLQEAVLEEVPCKTLYASDTQINAHIETVFRNQQFCVLKDMNDQSNGKLGLSQEKSLLHRLSATIHNGFDFNYEKLAKLKELKVTRNFCSSFNSVNKRLPANLPQFENLSLYQVMIASPRFGFNLNSQYEAKATITMALDAENDIVLRQSNTSWVDIKEIILRHLQPETYQELMRVKEELQRVSLKKDTLRKNFENCFLVANQDTLQAVNDYSVLKQSIEEIFLNSAATEQAREKYEQLINKNSMFSTYANTILMFFLSLKKLSKLMDEITYSWSSFKLIVDQILSKIMRDLKQKQEQPEEGEGKLSPSMEQIKRQESIKIDENFFKQVFLPQVHGVICTSIKQPLVSMFNLILALLIGLKSGNLTEDEVDLFYKRFFELEKAHLWRQHDHEFMDSNELIEKTRYFSIKRDLFKIYAEDADLRVAIENLEKEAGSEFAFRKVSQTLNQKIFVSKPGSDLSLFVKIQLGFLCPDQQFKSRLVQLVYEQIQPVFDFQEDLLKLHSFIKTASWRQPIALLSSNGINVINTVCSIASFYGVGLEVLRTDLPLDEEHIQKVNQGQKEALVQANLKDGFSHQEGFLRRNSRDQLPLIKTEVGHPDLQSITQNRASYLHAQDQSDPVLCQKNNYRASENKDQLQLDEKPQSQSQESALQVVRQCAQQGSWVFVSTLKFPTFWRKICSLLQEMNDQISTNFRIYFDLQGFIHGEIPDSFLFEHSVAFHLGEENNEDMEGFNDIWANILNGKILGDLSSVKEASIESRAQTREGPRNIPYNPNRTKQEILRNEIEQIEQTIDEGLSKSINSRDPANTLVFSSVLQDEQKEARNLKSQGVKELQGGSLNLDMNRVDTAAAVNPIQSEHSQKHEPLPNEVLVEEEIGQGGLVSAINSNENSVDISRGEKALIKDLQASGRQGAQSHRLHEVKQEDEEVSEKTEIASSPHKNVTDRNHSQILTRDLDSQPDKSLEDEIRRQEPSMSGASERALAEIQKRSGVSLKEEEEEKDQ